MDWVIEINNEQNYIEVITRGNADTDGSLIMAKALAHKMKTNRIKKALVDHRNLDSVTGGTLDIYDRPKWLKVIGLILQIRIAEIIKQEHVEHFKFFETVCFNRGYQISVFQSKTEALAWLLR